MVCAAPGAPPSVGARSRRRQCAPTPPRRAASLTLSRRAAGLGLGLSHRYATAQGGGGGADVPRAIAWQVTPPPRAPPPPPPAGPAWRGAARRAR